MLRFINKTFNQPCCYNFAMGYWSNSCEYDYVYWHLPLYLKPHIVTCIYIVHMAVKMLSTVITGISDFKVYCTEKWHIV